MKLSSICSVSLIVLATTSCASVRGELDSLCGEIASFANATDPGASHTVVLTTAWGPTKELPDSLMHKKCEHDDYQPGVRLCEYLMPNTSTEFAEHNFRRTLACFNGQIATPSRYIEVERLDTLMWGHDVPGVRFDVSVGVEFISGGDRTPTLKIVAVADAP